ncbi:MAG: hypothetical protein K1X57_16240 [Gemmataceae bacterium]|nr:hypothetical protein [Gemmataceae bacterium]
MQCPSAPVLEQLLTGELAAADAGPVRAHIEVCPRCQSHLDAATDAPDLPGRSPADNADLSRLLNRLRQMTPRDDDPPRPADDTGSGLLGTLTTLVVILLIALLVGGWYMVTRARRAEELARVEAEAAQAAMMQANMVAEAAKTAAEKDQEWQVLEARASKPGAGPAEREAVTAFWAKRVQDRPDDGVARRKLAASWVAQGDAADNPEKAVAAYTAAVAVLEELRQREPDSPFVKASLDAARESLERARKRAPGTPPEGP